MFSNRKERAELLDDALVVKDEEVTKHQFQQVWHSTTYFLINVVIILDLIIFLLILYQYFRIEFFF